MVAGGWGLSPLTFSGGVSVVGEVVESQHIGYGFPPITTLVPEVIYTVIVYASQPCTYAIAIYTCIYMYL